MIAINPVLNLGCRLVLKPLISLGNQCQRRHLPPRLEKLDNMQASISGTFNQCPLPVGTETYSRSLKKSSLEAVIVEFSNRLKQYPPSGMTPKERGALVKYRRLISIEVERLKIDLEEFNRTEFNGISLLELSLDKLTDLEAKIKTFVKTENRISAHCDTLNQKYNEYYSVAKPFESTKATLLNLSYASIALPTGEKNAIRNTLANVLSKGKMLDDTNLKSLGERFKPKDGSLNCEKNKKEHDKATESMTESRIRISNSLSLIKKAKELTRKEIDREMDKIDKDMINLQKLNTSIRGDHPDDSRADLEEVMIEIETEEERQSRLEAKKAKKKEKRLRYEDLMERQAIMQDPESQQNNQPRLQHDKSIVGRVDTRGVSIRYPIFLITTSDLENSTKNKGEESVFLKMKENPQIRSGKNNGFINDCGVIKYKVGTKDHRVIGTSSTDIMTPELKQLLGDQASDVDLGNKITFYKMSRIIDHKDYKNAQRGKGIKSLLGQW